MTEFNSQAPTTATDAFTPTKMRWYSSASGAKVMCITGKVEALPYGYTSFREFCAEDRPPHPLYGQFQWGFACSVTSRMIIFDGDYPDKWASTAVGRLLGPWQDVATSVRELDDGTVKFHVVVIVPLELIHLWPKRLPVLFGHIISNGLCYADGVHFTGTAYKNTGTPWLVADEALMRAMLADNGSRLHTDHGTASDDSIDDDADGWEDPDSTYSSSMAEGVLGNWVLEHRNESLPARCGIIKAAGDRAVRGMRTLFSDLCAEYDGETGRGDSDVYRAYARCYAAYRKADSQMGTAIPPQWQPIIDARAEKMAKAAANGHNPGAEIPQSGGGDTGQAQQAAPEWRRFTRVKASERTAKPVPWLWEPYLVRGALNLLAGYEGAGKSMVAVWIITQVTRGLWGMEPATVLVVATEDDWDSTIQPRLMAAGADLDKVEILSPPDGAPELTFPEDCPSLETEIRESGATLVILDPLLSRITERFDTHKDAEVRQALEPLKKVLERTGCAVLGLMHWSKNTSAHNPLDRLMGSRAFSAVTRSTLVVAPHPEDPGLKVLAHGKTNVGVMGVAMAFEILPWLCPQDAAIRSAMIRFLDKLEQFNISESFEPVKRAKESVTEVAAQLVTGMLDANGGAVRTADMITAAVDAGVSLNALRSPEVKILAEAGVRPVIGEKSAYAWCRNGIEPAAMMEALSRPLETLLPRARARAGGPFLTHGGRDLTKSDEMGEGSSPAVGSLPPLRGKRAPCAREEEVFRDVAIHDPSGDTPPPAPEPPPEYPVAPGVSVPPPDSVIQSYGSMYPAAPAVQPRYLACASCPKMGLARCLPACRERQPSLLTPEHIAGLRAIGCPVDDDKEK